MTIYLLSNMHMSNMRKFQWVFLFNLKIYWTFWVKLDTDHADVLCAVFPELAKFIIVPFAYYGFQWRNMKWVQLRRSGRSHPKNFSVNMSITPCQVPFAAWLTLILFLSFFQLARFCLNIQNTLLKRINKKFPIHQ